MAEKDGAASSQQRQSSSSAADAATRAPKGNPVFRMMGLPNFRFRLPSRNWMIFIGFTSSWTAALLYDRREKRRRQQKWCTLVSHLARDPLPTSQMQRRVTVFLAAPPADGLMRAREHFHEYVKPVLVASGLDWDVIEGRREGDVRAGLAERIRTTRKRNGEASAEPLEQDAENAVQELRDRAGIREWDGIQGDIVIGRHTWKEYVRGLHEGWLGPLDPPPPPTDPDPTLEQSGNLIASPVEGSTSVERASESTDPPSDDSSPTAATETTSTGETSTPPSDEESSEKKPQKRKQPPPFVSLLDYPSAMLSPSCPSILGPSTTVTYPHLLGFFNFPIRMYRFLTRRYVADEIGRQTAVAALEAYAAYDESSSYPSALAATSFSFDSASPAAEMSTVASEQPSTERPSSSAAFEQHRLLEDAEAEWHKSVRQRREDGKESVWLDAMVLDARIANRMRKFILTPEDEARAVRIAAGTESVRGSNKNSDDEVD